MTSLNGIDGLQRTDKLKAELANQLYEAISTIVLFAHALDVCVVVENPKNSLYWATSFAKRVPRSCCGLLDGFPQLLPWWDT